MKKFFVRLILPCLLASLAGKDLYAKDSYVAFSPDGMIRVQAGLHQGSLYYSVDYRGKPVVVESPLGLEFAGAAFIQDLQLISGKLEKGREEYDLVVGKASHVSDAYTMLKISVRQSKSPFRTITWHLRVFNHGLGFRYELPDWPGMEKFTLLRENSYFRFAGDPMIRALVFPNYTSSHEGVYVKMPVSQIPADTLIDLPALFEFPQKIYVAVTEAALVDYAGMYLSHRNEAGSLVSTLSPWPSDTAIKVSSTLPHNSPWRVLLIGDRMGDLIESNIITSLNEPCKIEDVSWIKPGKTTFPWWNGNVVPDTINAPGNNFVTNKYYIDFCARNHLEYHSVVEYGLHQWYMDDGANFQPGPHADVTTPVPGLDMKEICDYAHAQGVDVRVWVHWAALYPKLDTAFALFEQWGLSGMMVDFMDRDDQQMVNIQNEILQKAAAHHLHIQFHGAYKPTGLHRTWPNEFTREGTLNYESNKWANYITPDMDIDIPFTRMLAGSTDYHLGGFRAVPTSEIQPNYTRPLMLGTRCHMLAMYVVLENYLQMVCDYPDAYEGQPGFEFITEIPTTWDETRVLQSEPGKYILVARRKGDDWYLGAITNRESRKLSLSLTFLGPGSYQAEFYTDASDVSVHPNNLEKVHLDVNEKTLVNLSLAAGGGAVMRITKK